MNLGKTWSLFPKNLFTSLTNSFLLLGKRSRMADLPCSFFYPLTNEVCEQKKLGIGLPLDIVIFSIDISIIHFYHDDILFSLLFSYSNIPKTISMLQKTLVTCVLSELILESISLSLYFSIYLTFFLCKILL